MTDELVRFVVRELDVALPPTVAAVAAQLARELGGVAVLYYGSTLRTGDLGGVLDFYVLRDRAVGSLVRRAGMRWLWPDVSYHEVAVGAQTVRAKVATLPIATFERAARGRSRDSTIWTRFVQPVALAWRADPEVARRIARAVADATVTAARFAAVLGPDRGEARDYWLALFRATYRVELRVEPPGREGAILQHDPERYAQLLPMAWAAAGIGWHRDGPVLARSLAPELRRGTERAFGRHARAGKALNLARLVKAAFTFEGAARYGLWKVQRHTGVVLELTPWRERHPILAAGGVLWQVFRRGAA